jgi:hypothetical protein
VVRERLGGVGERAEAPQPERIGLAEHRDHRVVREGLREPVARESHARLLGDHVRKLVGDQRFGHFAERRAAGSHVAAVHAHQRAERAGVEMLREPCADARPRERRRAADDQVAVGAHVHHAVVRGAGQRLPRGAVEHEQAQPRHHVQRLAQEPVRALDAPGEPRGGRAAAAAREHREREPGQRFEPRSVVRRRAGERGPQPGHRMSGEVDGSHEGSGDQATPHGGISSVATSSTAWFGKLVPSSVSDGVQMLTAPLSASSCVSSSAPSPMCGTMSAETPARATSASKVQAVRRFAIVFMAISGEAGVPRLVMGRIFRRPR